MISVTKERYAAQNERSRNSRTLRTYGPVKAPNFRFELRLPGTDVAWRGPSRYSRSPRFLCGPCGAWCDTNAQASM